MQPLFSSVAIVWFNVLGLSIGVVAGLKRLDPGFATIKLVSVMSQKRVPTNMMTLNISISVTKMPTRPDLVPTILTSWSSIFFIIHFVESRYLSSLGITDI